MKSQTFLCSGMKWCIPWLILGGHFVGQTFWAITALRKKTWGKHHILVNQFLESCFNPLIPTIRMLRNILPFGLEAKLWNSYRDEHIHFVADCFERIEVVFVLESYNDTNSAETYHILWECLQKSCPSNQSSANWCDCPTEKKNKRSVNLFTTHPTKIVNIISLQFSYLSRFMESIGIWFPPVIFSQISHGTMLTLC